MCVAKGARLGMSWGFGQTLTCPVAFARASAAAGVISLVAGILWLGSSLAFAQGNAGRVSGNVTDVTGGRLPGVVVALYRDGAPRQTAATDGNGGYAFDAVAPGDYDVTFALINFAQQTRRGVRVPAGQSVSLDMVLRLTLTADVTVTGRQTFTNLADVTDPVGNLVGVANAASEGAVTARQTLESRPIMRAGEVLEAVPGVIISQHSGEGKANQGPPARIQSRSWHRLFEHTVVAGLPVNLPTHAHGQGYSDSEISDPEAASGVQFRKGPYFARESDFSAAGAVNVNYVNFLDRPIVEVSGGGQGWARALAAASPRVGRGRVLAALELNRNDGPWTLADDYRKVNGIVRYSEGGAAVRVLGDGHVLPRRMECDRPGAGARHYGRRYLAIRPHRPDERRRDASLQPVDRCAMGRRQHVDEEPTRIS